MWEGESKRTFPYCYLQGDMFHMGFPKPFPESSSMRNDWLQLQFQYCRIGFHPLVVHTSGSNCQHDYLYKAHMSTAVDNDVCKAIVQIHFNIPFLEEVR